MDPNDILTGISIVCATFLCVSLGFAMKTQSRMLGLQVELLQTTGELGKAFAALAGQIMGSTPGGVTNTSDNWRELPPEGRAMLRQALRKVLADILTTEPIDTIGRLYRCR